MVSTWNCARIALRKSVQANHMDVRALIFKVWFSTGSLFDRARCGESMIAARRRSLKLDSLEDRILLSGEGLEGADVSIEADPALTEALLADVVPDGLAADRRLRPEGRHLRQLPRPGAAHRSGVPAAGPGA